jgi:hypothetical protein
MPHLLLSGLNDLIGHRVNALFESMPILVEAREQRLHPWRHFLGTLAQNRFERDAQRAWARAHGDALLNQEGADLIDGGRATRDQSGTHAVERL